MNYSQQTILTHLQYLDQNNQFQAIIDYISTLNFSETNFEILCELARAYNNLYWQHKIFECRYYLEKSIEILSKLSPKSIEQQDIWHYNLGYSYYFLEDFIQAQTHLLSVQDYCLSHVHDLLKQITWIKRYKISAIEASLQHTHYLLQDIFTDIKQYLPELYASFKQGVNPKELDIFQQKIGFELPNSFQQFYLTLNGQNNKSILQHYYSLGDYFVSLNEIKDIQQQWQVQLKKYFAHDWRSLKLLDENIDSDYIQNQLFHAQWLPILVGQHHYICVDLAPKYTEDYGQIIYVRIMPQLEECVVFYYCDALQDLLDLFLQEIKSHYQIENNLLVKISKIYS